MNRNLLLISICAHSLLTGAELAEPTRWATFSRAFYDGMPLPKWSGSYLVSWTRNTHATEALDNVTIYDRGGKVVSSHRIWYPDAGAVTLIDATANGNTVAVLGQAMNRAGVYVGFVASLAVGSTNPRILPLGSFEGTSIAFGEDRTLWVLGYQVGEERRIKTAPRHATLRHYKPDGETIRRVSALAGYPMWTSLRCRREGWVPSGDSRPRPHRRPATPMSNVDGIHTRWRTPPDSGTPPCVLQQC